MLVLTADRRHAVVVLSNCTSTPVNALAMRIVDLLRGDEVTPIPIHKPVPVAAKILQDYVGAYQLAPLVKFVLTRKGDGLYAKLGAQPAFRIYPKSETEFVYRVVDARIVFERAESGEVTRLVLHQNGREMPASKVE